MRSFAPSLPPRPQKDMRGILECAHCLLFGEYLRVESARDGSGRLRPALALKRYWATDIWADLFDSILNADVLADCTRALVRVSPQPSVIPPQSAVTRGIHRLPLIVCGEPRVERRLTPSPCANNFGIGPHAGAMREAHPCALPRRRDASPACASYAPAFVATVSE